MLLTFMWYKFNKLRYDIRIIFVSKLNERIPFTDNIRVQIVAFKREILTF